MKVNEFYELKQIGDNSGPPKRREARVQLAWESSDSCEKLRIL